jgi:AraC-like DNA-binding protein
LKEIIMSDIIRIETISQALEGLGLDKPKHPLVSVFKHEDLKQNKEFLNRTIVMDFYHVDYKMCSTGAFKYGRNTYDFQEGTLIFMQPGQVIRLEEWDEDPGIGGWSLFFHPDLIRKSQLGKHIDRYTFFSYDVNEALHLSDDEKAILEDIRDKIVQEYSLNIDRHSQKLIISNIELMLDYCTRFYDRQFYTRTNMNADFVSRFERLVADYIESEPLRTSGLPSVKYCAEQLSLSPNYLSDMLKKETGKSAQEHIHFHIIEKAKTVLLNSDSSVSEIAYDFGFEYPQYFSKLFTEKVGMSPAKFRNVN